MKHACIMLLMVSCLVSHTRAQDTQRITLPEAEKQFIQKNLALIAGKYNIDIARAQVVQARLFSNPTLTLNGNLYNPANRKLLDVSNKTGQYDIGLQQLIRLAGKRNKEVKLAEAAVSISEDQFYDLLRTLRFELRSDFYNAAFLWSSIGGYDRQIAPLEQMNASYEQLLQKGVVTPKDALRIKSLLYSLRAEKAALQNQWNDLEASLQLLLQDNRTTFMPILDPSFVQYTDVRKYTVAGLIDSAYANRYDLKAAQATVQYSQQNLRLQKALAKPDLTLGGEFDRRGSFVDNASFINLAIDLPFFRRNQGNIRAAGYAIDQSKAQYEWQRQSVENDVQRAYLKALNSDDLLRSIDPSFGDQFSKLLAGVTENFQKHNISLIEFTDFNESYKSNLLQFNQLQNDKMQAIEALHYAVGKTIINPSN